MISDLPPSTKPSEALRADAERNRERILAAARRLFSRDGLGVSMTAVAREAGVGTATLFRRFATKALLIDAVFMDRVSVYSTLVTTCSKDPDPWQGFTDYVQCVCTLQAADPAFVEVLTIALPSSAVESRRAAAGHGVLELISRAKKAGHLRQDFSDRDLTILLIANSGVMSAIGATSSDALRRLTAQMLRAFATPNAPLTPIPDAPPRAELYHAMINLLRSQAPCQLPVGSGPTRRTRQGR